MLAAPFRDPLLEFSGSLQEALVTDVVEGRLAEWIWQNDRNAMMSSIENRSPFLDHRLAPFMGTGYAAKFHGPWNKHELRRCYDAFRPLPTQWRREKQGFRWVGHWFLRENTARALELIRASQALAPFVDVPRFVDAAAADDLVLTCELTSRLVSVAGVEAAVRAYA
jgi:asparagine synthase (glutamine-hydrolysing)